MKEETQPSSGAPPPPKAGPGVGDLLGGGGRPTDPALLCGRLANQVTRPSRSLSNTMPASCSRLHVEAQCWNETETVLVRLQMGEQSGDPGQGLWAEVGLQPGSGHIEGPPDIVQYPRVAVRVGEVMREAATCVCLGGAGRDPVTVPSLPHHSGGGSQLLAGRWAQQA